MPGSFEEDDSTVGSSHSSLQHNMHSPSTPQPHPPVQTQSSAQRAFAKPRRGFRQSISNMLSTFTGSETSNQGKKSFFPTGGGKSKRGRKRNKNDAHADPSRAADDDGDSVTAGGLGSSLTSFRSQPSDNNADEWSLTTSEVLKLLNIKSFKPVQPPDDADQVPAEDSSYLMESLRFTMDELDNNKPLKEVLEAVGENEAMLAEEDEGDEDEESDDEFGQETEDPGDMGGMSLQGDDAGESGHMQAINYSAPASIASKAADSRAHRRLTARSHFHRQRQQARDAIRQMPSIIVHPGDIAVLNCTPKQLEKRRKQHQARRRPARMNRQMSSFKMRATDGQNGGDGGSSVSNFFARLPRSPEAADPRLDSNKSLQSITSTTNRNSTGTFVHESRASLLPALPGSQQRQPSRIFGRLDTRNAFFGTSLAQ